MSIESVVYSSKSKKLIIVVDPETTKFELESVKIDSSKMLELHDGSFVRGLAITFSPSNPSSQGFKDPSNEPYDYVCRYFAPWVGIDEDPATGSAQCVMGPFWSIMLGKHELYALQVTFSLNKIHIFHLSFSGISRSWSSVPYSTPR